nr:copia protein [Tanacetum cinerariifolium]
MKEKRNPCILVGYSTQSKEYHVYNKRTRLIVESIHFKFDEIKEMSETSVSNGTLGLVPQQQKALDYDNSDPVPQIQNVLSSADTTVPSQQKLDLLFGPLYDEFFNAEDEFTNPFCTSVREVAESSSRNIGGGLCCTTRWCVDLDHPDKVYQLRKALYGLKQAPRAWYDELSQFLMSKGFTKDADHARCINTHKSTSGGIQFIGDKLFNWMLKKQDCTAMSSAEAEYVALSASCAQHSRTKHIHTRYHFIKEQVKNAIIELYFVKTEYQLADMFNKALPEDRFQYLVRRIGIRCLTPLELEILTNESA